VTFKQVQEAYAILSDAVKKHLYDAKIPKPRPKKPEKAKPKRAEMPPSTMSIADAPPSHVDLWGEPINRPREAFVDTFAGTYEGGGQPSIR
jgi:DnaJ-class molecular chaperone